MKNKKCRNLILVLGDQLDRHSSAFDGFDSEQDIIWMAEVAEESTHVWSHKARIVLFLSAMRHFHEELQQADNRVDYQYLDAKGNKNSFEKALKAAIAKHSPARCIVVKPGEWRVQNLLQKLADNEGVEIEIREDRHFFSTPQEFAEHAEGRKQLRQEYFYRELRRKHNLLVEDDKPVGGKWNYDAKNRGSFGKKGPGKLPSVRRFEPDEITAEVIELVEKKFADHPGSLAHFDWPISSKQAKLALNDFIKNRLASFGDYQDAMWTDEPYLYHARISAALNLKLLDPRLVVDKAIKAYEDDEASLNSVEGFIRQILGWREYVRGVYWLLMPEYLDRNTLKAKASLPEFFWSGETDMNCLSQTIKQTLDYGYAHHIQRLMVTGLFCLLAGIDPKLVHEWYLAVYVDAVEWVELPNSFGMSQYADEGVMASKPYVASGKYIQRMSNYCVECAFDPAEATGEKACPFTTLYWDFLARHKEDLKTNNRMSMQLKNLERKEPEEIAAIQSEAKALRKSFS